MSVKYVALIFVISGLFFADQTVLLATPLAKGCDIETSDLSFGTYIASSKSPDNSQVKINIECGDSTVYSFSLAANQGDSGNFAQRYMNGPGKSVLNYNLFIDPNFQTIWGDGTSYQAIQFKNACSEKTGGCNLVAYGSIPAGDYSATPGSYNDKIKVTLTVN